jgi:hypothetical protein
MDRVETMAAHMPPMVYCKMSNIVSPTGARSRGLAHQRGRHPQGNAGAQPRVHLPAPACGGEDGRTHGRADHGPGRVHESRRRRRHHGGAARAAARHHRQQLLGIGRAVGRCRRDAPHGPGQAAPGGQARDGQDHGHRRHRLHRFGQRAAAGHGLRRGRARRARPAQARGTQGLDPEGHAQGQGGVLDRLRRAAGRDGHDRHQHLGCGQEDPGHHEGQAGLRHHRRGPPAGPAARGGGQAARRAGDRIRRDRTAHAGARA